MKLNTALPFLLVTPLLLTACGDTTPDQPLPEGVAPGEVASSNTELDAAAVDVQPKPKPGPEPEAEPGDLNASGETDRTTIAGLSFVLPEGWSIGAEKPMRLLTLLPPDADGADLAVSKWPGDVGGFAANVGRWARQVGLPPVAGLTTAGASDYEQFEIDGTAATWIPLMNEQAGLAILAVWVPRGEDPDQPTQTWTLKLTCKATQVDKLAPAVRAWCESIKFED